MSLVYATKLAVLSTAHGHLGTRGRLVQKHVVMEHNTDIVLKMLQNLAEDIPAMAPSMNLANVINNAVLSTARGHLGTRGRLVQNHVIMELKTDTVRKMLPSHAEDLLATVPSMNLASVTSIVALSTAHGRHGTRGRSVQSHVTMERKVDCGPKMLPSPAMDYHAMVSSMNLARVTNNAALSTVHGHLGTRGRLVQNHVVMELKIDIVR